MPRPDLVTGGWGSPPRLMVDVGGLGEPTWAQGECGGPGKPTLAQGAQQQGAGTQLYVQDPLVLLHDGEQHLHQLRWPRQTWGVDRSRWGRDVGQTRDQPRWESGASCVGPGWPDTVRQVCGVPATGLPCQLPIPAALQGQPSADKNSAGVTPERQHPWLRLPSEGTSVGPLRLSAWRPGTCSGPQLGPFPLPSSLPACVLTVRMTRSEVLAPGKLSHGWPVSRQGAEGWGGHQGPLWKGPSTALTFPGSRFSLPMDSVLATAQLDGIAGREEGRETAEGRSPWPQEGAGAWPP